MALLNLLFTIPLTMLMMVLTVTLAIVFSFKSADVSSSMVVLTGRRTRDWSTPNSYSMHSMTEDHHTRLYACMMQADINKAGTVMFRTTIGGFRQDAKDHYNCGPESDRGWPRDYGFLRCLQTHFDANFHQSNVFLKCLDLSEGVMVESIQTPSSGVFLGSYNFVAMLIASMGVITAFLIFTAGGAFVWKFNVNPTDFDKDKLKTFGEIKESRYGHIADFWMPMSGSNIVITTVWSFFLLVSSLFYTFPLNDTWSDIPAVGDRAAFPTTPWGGYVVSLVFLVMFAFFFSYYMEWMCDTQKTHKKADAGSIIPSASFQTSQIKSVKPLDVITPRMVTSPNVFPGPTAPIPTAILLPTPRSFALPVPVLPTQRSFALPVPVLPTQRSFSLPVPALSTQKSFALPVPVLPTQKSFPALSSSSITDSSLADWGQPDEVSSFAAANQYYQPPSQIRLGIRADTYAESSAYDMSRRLFPFINKAFACTWVFADGLLFVGMLNSQNSLLTENVVTIWYYIFLCRGFQLAGTFFMDRILFEPQFSTDEKPESKSHEPNLIAACCQLCSFWCFVVVLFHFFNSFAFPYSISTMGIGMQTATLQIMFMIVMVVLEALRHTLVFYAILWPITIKRFAANTKLIFAADCVLRTVFIVSTISSVTAHLGDENSILYSYLSKV